MSIESRINSKEINIKALNVEQPEAGSFDLSPEKYITAEDKELMLATLEFYRHNRMWVNFNDLAVNIKTLFPDLEPELKLTPDITEKILNGDGAMKGIKELDKETFYPGYLYQSEKFLELLPDQIKLLDLNEEAWQSAKAALEDTIKKGMVSTTLRLAVDMKILFPNKQHEVVLPKEQQNLAEAEIKQLRDSGEWDQVANLLAHYKLLFAEDAEKFDLAEPESREIVGSLKKKSHEMANNDQFRIIALNFSELALHMKIITASETRLTGKGIEIIANKQLARPKQ